MLYAGRANREPPQASYEMAAINSKQPNSRPGKRGAPIDCGGKNPAGKVRAAKVEDAHRRPQSTLAPSKERANRFSSCRLQEDKSLYEDHPESTEGEEFDLCLPTVPPLMPQPCPTRPHAEPEFRPVPGQIHSSFLPCQRCQPAHVPVKSRACTCRRLVPLITR